MGTTKVDIPVSHLSLARMDEKFNFRIRNVYLPIPTIQNEHD